MAEWRLIDAPRFKLPENATMPTTPPSPSPTAPTPAVLDRALAQSQEVREKVEDCADELASTNDAIKEQISRGKTSLPAQSSLAQNEVVEAKVQECVVDLHQVTETLAQGVVELKRVEFALANSRRALAQTESSLADSQEEERRSRFLALHDAATGLPNRTLFDDRLEQAIALAERNRWLLAVLFIDLNGFKQINDTQGHAVGDLVLKEVANRLRQQGREEDTVCRNGGDEFLYLLVNPKGPEYVERIAADTLTNIARPMSCKGLDLTVGASIGIALFPEGATTGAELIAHADTAMYGAKRARSGYALWNQPQ